MFRTVFGKCLQDWRVFGKGFGNVFLKVCTFFLENAVITFLKVWSFVGSMFWKRVGTFGYIICGKAFV